MKWKVLFFETNSGKSPVDKFINKQQKPARSKILHLLELLEDYGFQLGMPRAKALGLGIYELRVHGREEIRILYCFKKNNIYLLHAFKKQTNKMPQKEFIIAIERNKKLDTI